MQTIAYDDLVDLGARILMNRGVPDASARTVAEAAVKTEACGIHTHGVVLFGYLDSMLGEEFDPKAEPVVVSEKGATALIDGNNAIGHLAMKKAVELATDKAKTHGAATIAVTNASWLGGLGVHLMPLAEAGFLAQLWAQSSLCRDCAPVGGIDAKFSTNPVALAFPAPGDPVVADIASAAVSMGRVGQMKRAGEKAPAAIFMDNNGALTDDPNAVDDGGSILFAGGETHGHKGYALSLWCEALAALAGGHCNNPDLPQRQSFTLTVIDPDAFAGSDYFAAEITRFVTHMKSSRLRPGVGAIRLPGERSYANLHRARSHGVEIEDHVAEELRALAEKNGVPWTG